jgi:hypothetical protein
MDPATSQNSFKVIKKDAFAPKAAWSGQKVRKTSVETVRVVARIPSAATKKG